MVVAAGALLPALARPRHAGHRLPALVGFAVTPGAQPVDVLDRHSPPQRHAVGRPPRCVARPARAPTLCRALVCRYVQSEMITIDGTVDKTGLVCPEQSAASAPLPMYIS